MAVLSSPCLFCCYVNGSTHVHSTSVMSVHARVVVLVSVILISVHLILHACVTVSRGLWKTDRDGGSWLREISVVPL